MIYELTIYRNGFYIYRDFYFILYGNDSKIQMSKKIQLKKKNLKIKLMIIEIHNN